MYSTWSQLKRERPPPVGGVRSSVPRLTRQLCVGRYLSSWFPRNNMGETPEFQRPSGDVGPVATCLERGRPQTSLVDPGREWVNVDQTDIRGGSRTRIQSRASPVSLGRERVSVLGRTFPNSYHSPHLQVGTVFKLLPRLFLIRDNGTVTILVTWTESVERMVWWRLNDIR